MEFSTDYQKELIGKCCLKDFGERIGHLLHPDMFDPLLQDLVAEILRCTRKAGYLSKAQLVQICTRRGVAGIKPDARKIQDFDVEEVEYFARQRSWRQAVVEAGILVDDRQWSAAEQTLTNCFRHLPSALRDGGEDILKGSRPLPQRKNVRNTGLASLDEALQGGVGAGDLAVVSAGISGGKSSFLCHLAAHCLERGLCCVYVTLELSTAMIEAKIRSALCNRSQPPRSVWEKKRKQLGKRKLRCIVQEYSYGSVNPLELGRALPDEAQIVFVDHADDLAPVRSAYGQDHVSLKETYDYLRRIAGDRGIPLWTASQLNREGQTDANLGFQHVAGSLGKAAVADVCVILVQEQRDRPDPCTGETPVDLFILKNRVGPRYVTIGLTAHWGKSKFWERKNGA